MDLNHESKVMIRNVALAFIFLTLLILMVINWQLAVGLLFLILLIFATLLYFRTDLISTVMEKKYPLDSLIEPKSKPGQSGFLSNRYVLINLEIKEMITPIDSTPFVIGRMADCDIQTLENQISKRHCAIVFRKKNQKYYLKDLGSQNGTFLNGHYIENAVPVELKDQDVIQVGKSRYRFSARNET